MEAVEGQQQARVLEMARKERWGWGRNYALFELLALIDDPPIYIKITVGFVSAQGLLVAGHGWFGAC